MSQFTKPVWSMTPHEAGVLVDTVDRKRWLKVTAEEYDDLLLVASGHAALVKAAGSRKVQEKTCRLCGNSFIFARATAVYCSETCKKRAQRRPMSR